MKHQVKIFYFLLFLVFLNQNCFLFAEEIVEKYENGQIKLKKNIDEEGKLHGLYLSYHENGKLHIKAKYKRGELHGPYLENYENKKPRIKASYKNGLLNGSYKETLPNGETIESTYKKGKLNGTSKRKAAKTKKIINIQVWKNGVIQNINGIKTYDRPLKEIRNTLSQISEGKKDAPSSNPSLHTEDKKWSSRLNALRTLQAYRYLCKVPYENMIIDPKLNTYTDAASQVCEKLGKLSHTPPNPGLPGYLYNLGYKGAHNSNLWGGAHGENGMSDSVHMYMDDSDATNIDRVGHRRWSLNPKLLKTSFGISGSYTAMWATDQSRSSVPKIDYVAFPSAGYFPIEYFGDHYAWSVMLGPKYSKYENTEPAVKVFPLDVLYQRKSDSLPINDQTLNTKKYGFGSCLIFRPQEPQIAPRQKYWVEITFSKNSKKKRQKVEKIEYLVEFFSFKKTQEDSK